MIFTPYTQPVKPAEFVGTVDLNVYAKGLANKQQMYEQNLKSVTDDFSKLFSKNAYGPDKERLQALENQLREEVGSINLSDLTDMGTVSKIKGLIRSYGSDPQMLAIAKRTSTYETELSNQQKAMEKGEKYTSPALDTLGKYYNQSNFYEKPKGVNLTNGWYSFNEAKALKAAKDLVKEREEIVEDAQGRRVIKKYYDPSDLYAALKIVQASDPSYEKDMNYQFQQQYEDIDWQDYANEEHATIAKEAENAMEQAKLIINNPNYTSAERASALKNYQDAEKYFNIYSDIYNSPESVEEVKQNTFNDFKNRRMQRMISAVDAVQNTPAAMDEIKKMQLQQSMDISKMQQTEIFKQKAELYKYLGEDGIKKINEGKINEITPKQWNDAAKGYEAAKLKNARAVAEGINPDIKLKRQVPAGGLTPTYEQATEGLESKKDEAIPESRFKYHINNILENEKYFRKLMKSTYSEQDIDKIIETLKKNKKSYNSGVFTNDIKSSNKTMEVDPDGPGQYQIPKDVLENLVNNQYNKIYGGEDLNLEESPQEESSGSATGSESTTGSFKQTAQYTVENKTIEAPIITNLSDTSKLAKGAYFSYNGELYKNQ